MEIGERIEVDIPGNPCFGCGPENPQGLRLEFSRSGERSVQTRFVASPHHCGAPDVIHGGIQATLLDEVMGIALRLLCAPGEDPHAVTADFKLRYRRPAFVAKEVVVEGTLVREEGRNRFLEGRILEPSGEVLTTAEARWVVIESRPTG